MISRELAETATLSVSFSPTKAETVSGSVIIASLFVTGNRDNSLNCIPPNSISWLHQIEGQVIGVHARVSV
jgi:hypothetical protein